jgi:hypothetical protein
VICQLTWCFCICSSLKKLLQEDGFYTIRLPSNVLDPTRKDNVVSSIKVVSWLITHQSVSPSYDYKTTPIMSYSNQWLPTDVFKLQSVLNGILFSEQNPPA